MKIIKNIIDKLNTDNIRIVGNTYIPLIGEEFVFDPKIGEILNINNRIDYIKFRKLLKNIVDDNLSDYDDEERLIFIKNYVKPTDILWDDLYIDEDILLGYWQNVVEKERNNRRFRYNETIGRVTWLLTPIESYNAWMDISELVEYYIEAELPNLFLFITNGTDLDYDIDYSTNGFSSKSLYSTQIKNIILDIMFND